RPRRGQGSPGGHHSYRWTRRFGQTAAAPRRSSGSQRRRGHRQVALRAGGTQRPACRSRRGDRDSFPSGAPGSTLMLQHPLQHLIIDADDTLWANNIYFERAFNEFVEYLDHSTLAAPEIRQVLDEIELANSRIHGYG